MLHTPYEPTFIMEDAVEEIWNMPFQQANDQKEPNSQHPPG